MFRIFTSAALLCALANAQDATLAARLDPKISSLLTASGAPSVSVIAVVDGNVAYAKAFGQADIAQNRPATTSTRYAIGSVSKQFTASAILLLQEEGKLSLDDKVAKWFPDLTRANEVTVRQLLTHTSGYEDYAPQDYIIPEWTKPTTSAVILNTWAKKPLNYDPGTRWQYSNTGYVIAGEIIEKASGMSLVDFLKARILNPLGMSSAGDCSVLGPSDATAYTRFALGPPRPVAREGSGWYNGAGELCMTPSDLAKWDIAVLNRRILSPRSYEELAHPVTLADGKKTNYALGVVVSERNGSPVYTHDGEVSGFLASNQVFLKPRDAVIVCSNEDGINLIGSIAQEIVRTILPSAENAPSEAITAQVRAILEGLQQGRIDRSLLTSNANAYFTDTALGDYKTSLSALGKLEAVTAAGDQLRGGMTHLSYRARFEKKTVSLNIYRTPDGKYEQYMVMEQI
jgi:CubicO group peptidase (beta-lactamase class C family)